MQADALSYRALTYALLGNGLVVQTHVIECCIGDVRAACLGTRLRIDPRFG